MMFRSLTLPLLCFAGFAFARDRQRGDHQRGHQQDCSDQTRNDVQCRDLLGVVAIVNDHSEWRRGWRGLHVGWQIALQHVGVQRHQCSGCFTDRHRVRSIGIQQHGRVLAAIHGAGESRRDFQHEQYVAARQRFVGLVFGLEGTDIEIPGASV